MRPCSQHRGVAQSGSASALGAEGRRFKSGRLDTYRFRPWYGRGKAPPAACRRISALVPCARSSTGQSGGLLIRRLQVRVLPGVLRRDSNGARSRRSFAGIKKPAGIVRYGKTVRKSGDVAEWLGKGLQNLVRRFESARHLTSRYNIQASPHLHSLAPGNPLPHDRPASHSCPLFCVRRHGGLRLP